MPPPTSATVVTTVPPPTAITAATATTSSTPATTLLRRPLPPHRQRHRRSAMPPSSRPRLHRGGRSTALGRPPPLPLSRGRHAAARTLALPHFRSAAAPSPRLGCRCRENNVYIKFLFINSFLFLVGKHLYKRNGPRPLRGLTGLRLPLCIDRPAARTLDLQIASNRVWWRRGSVGWENPRHERTNSPTPRRQKIKKKNSDGRKEFALHQHGKGHVSSGKHYLHVMCILVPFSFEVAQIAILTEKKGG